MCVIRAGGLSVGTGWVWVNPRPHIEIVLRDAVVIYAHIMCRICAITGFIIFW